MAKLSLEYYEICKAGVNGHYEAEYFRHSSDSQFSLESPDTLSRLRAVIQFLNTEFSKTIAQSGHKYEISMTIEHSSSPEHRFPTDYDQPRKVLMPFEVHNRTDPTPRHMNREEGLKWVRNVLVRTRGKELVGNFNPLLVGELFWEQSIGWKVFATRHIDQLSGVCESFLKNLLESRAPLDVRTRIWASRILPALKGRRQLAYGELEKLMEDIKNFPLNYNHYYTDRINKRRQDRQKTTLKECLEDNTAHSEDDESGQIVASVDIERTVDSFFKNIDPDMDNFSSEEALDCLMAIYDVSFKFPAYLGFHLKKKCKHSLNFILMPLSYIFLIIVSYANSFSRSH